MNIYLWAIAGVAGWWAIFIVAISFGRAAARPWPKQPRTQRFRRR